MATAIAGSGALDTVATKATAVFYVIFGIDAGRYLHANRDFTAITAQEAKRYSSVSNLLNSAREHGSYGRIEIRRVEEITVKSTEQRRILDHGEQAPAGAEIKYGIFNYAGGTPSAAELVPAAPKSARGDLVNYGYGRVSLENAILFDREAIAAQFQRPETNCWRFIRRVAITRTPAKPEYKVTTLA